MTNLNQNPQTNIPKINPIKFIEHQLDHYNQLLMDAKDDARRIFLRKEVYNLKQAYITYYN